MGPGHHTASQRPVSWSCDPSQPIRDPYLGHVIPLSQSEASIQVMWPLSANQRPVSRSCDQSKPIRGQYSAHGTWPPHSPLLSLPIITRATAWVADGVPLSFRLFDIDSHFEERVTALNVGSLCIPAIVAVASWDMRRSKDVRDYSRDYDRRSGDKFVVTPSKHSTNSQSQASLSRLGNPSKIPSTSVQNTSYK